MTNQAKTTRTARAAGMPRALRAAAAMLIAVAATLPTTVARAQGSLKKLDERNGFKGIVLGDSISKYDNLVREETEDGSITYEVHEFDRMVGNAEIESLVVTEFEGLIYAIQAVFGYSDGFGVKDVLEAAYGPAKIDLDRKNLRYSWMGKKAALSISWSTDPLGSIVSFISRDIARLKDKRSEEVRDRKKARVRAAAKTDL